jgi:hypothetical protein
MHVSLLRAWQLPRETEVPSGSEAGLCHTVTRLPDGSLECSCAGFRYQARSDGLCRHIDDVNAAGQRTRCLAEVLL